MSRASERLFAILSDVNDQALDEAAQAMERRPPRRWIRRMGAAAVLAVVLGLGLFPFLPGKGGAGGTGSTGMGTYMSYAGPVMPLTLREPNGSITARRDITLDFAPWKRDSDAGDILVTDAYTLANTSSQDQTVSVLYPFASDLYGLDSCRPAMELDGQALETVLHAGGYSGGFYGAWGSRREDLPELSLAYADSWEAYRAVLRDGTYQAAALEDFPDLSGVPVTVYDFLDPWPEWTREFNPTFRVSFTLAYGESCVLTTGFHGMTYDPEEGTMSQFFFPPRADETVRESYRLVVLGEDIRDLEVQCSDSWEEDGRLLEDFGVTVRRTESDLETAFREIAEEDYSRPWHSWSESVDFTLYFGLAKEQLAGYYGILDEDPAVRYADFCITPSDLDFVRADRVFYLEAEVTVPAGKSVTLTAEMRRNGSHDLDCSEKNRGIYGYDLVTGLGSNLACTGQTATLEDRGVIAVIRDNFGFDLKHGVRTVELDPAREHYWLEVRRAG